jgi:hypothetical protein
MDLFFSFKRFGRHTVSPKAVIMQPWSLLKRMPCILHHIRKFYFFNKKYMHVSYSILLLQWKSLHNVTKSS